MSQRVNRKRLTIDIPLDIHKELKMFSIQHNITLTKYVSRILISALKQEREWNKPIGNEDKT